MTKVVALVPAYNRADSIADTVAAIRSIDQVDQLLVIDDGSTDATVEAARRAGAEVLVLPANRGKGGAVLAGAQATPEADVYLLLDADLADTAAVASGLLESVLAGEADMTIAVLPPANGRGGFGKVRQLAAAGIRRGCGFEARAPLSGQRAIRADLLRELRHADRFGLEVALTIDAVNAGARVVEVELPMDHRHTGRSVSGFRHRASQGVDIVRSLWPRLVSPRNRAVLIATAVIATLVLTFITSKVAVVPSEKSPGGVTSVVLFGIPHLSLNDIDSGNTPNLDRLIAHGALASMSVRTLRSHPTSVEAYATLSAGTRVGGNDVADAAYPRGYEVDGGTAAQVAARRSGRPTSGRIVDIGAATLIRTSGSHISSLPGALGDALARHHLHTAVVANSDVIGPDLKLDATRPAAVAAMDSRGGIGRGKVDESLLEPADAPFGVAVRPSAFVAAARSAMDHSQFTVLDPGEMDRFFAYKGLVPKSRQPALRNAALKRTDVVLGDVVKVLPAHAMLLVVGVTPPSSNWELTPLVAYGAGVIPGHLHSLSTNRPDLVTLTDVAPTVLAALHVKQPTGMVGVPLRYRPGKVDIGSLTSFDRLATGRDQVSTSMATSFIVIQAAAYVLLFLLFNLGAEIGRLAGAIKMVVLTFAAWPLASFLLKIVPRLMELGLGTIVVTWAVAALIAAAVVRARGHPLAALSRITSATVLLLVADVATGANLQIATVLGYSPHTATRFTGYGNPAYAVLAACAMVTAVVHVDRWDSAFPAVFWAAGVLGIVVVADGAPWLGTDVGGIISLVPIFTLTVYVLSGRRIRFRTVVAAVLATAAVLGAAIGIDFLRPPDARSHLAKFVFDSIHGRSTFWNTVARKWSDNVKVFSTSLWTWAVPVIAIFSVYILVLTRGWQRLLPDRSPLRIGVVGALCAGILGWLVNDSGIVITALVLVYLGPFLTLLALRECQGQPQLLEPLGAVG